MNDVTQPTNTQPQVNEQSTQLNIFGEREPVMNTPQVSEPEPEVTLDNYDDMWNDEVITETQQAEQAPQEAATGDTRFHDYLSRLEFIASDDITALNTAMEAQDPQAMKQVFNKVGQQAYQKALLDANVIMQKKMEELEKRMEQKTETNLSAREAISRLNAALPIASKPAVAPLAKSIYGQFLRKGDSVDAAIQKTIKYFDSLGVSVKGNTNKQNTNVNESMDMSDDRALNGTSIEELFG